MIYGESCTITYTAWDSSTGMLLTGDVSNHTSYISMDGGQLNQTSYMPIEIGNGLYAVTLSNYETLCDVLTLSIVSTTSTCVIPPVQVTFHTPEDFQSDVSSIPSSVWSCSSRTLTDSVSVSGSVEISDSSVSSIQSGLATSAEVSSLPTAEQTAESVWSADTRTLSGIGTSGIASASQLSTVKGMVSAQADILAQVSALISHWSLTGDVLTAYDSDGDSLGTWSVTRDANEVIVSMTPVEASTLSEE